RAAAHLIADSQATQDDLVRFYHADPARITVVHLGIDGGFRPMQDPAATAAVKAQYGIDGPYLLYLGTLQPRKNLSRLIQSFARVPLGEIKLVLAGKRGWLAEDLRAQAEAAGVGARVVLPGFVDDADRPALYSGASLFVMPSLYEGFCFPVLEAMACGTPVACSNTSSLPEVVGDAALLFDPTDMEAMTAAITQVLDNATLRAQLIRRGLERSATFTWERCARQTAVVLDKVYRQ
ncbi:MAG: glycosyltransferase family 4 protein, partial [Anaerolineae bacterium]|nr:glycosyltransferase family 4 protein [Anaerolineae bacterium]